MVEREKVMDALRRCPANKCDGFPYKETYDKYGYGCLNEVDMDALELLKEQAEQIERLQHDLAVAEDNLAFHIHRERLEGR
ncbi:MAG: hypothetical protein IKE25_05720 [Clostridia bacterium]|nr:hypothetical protein [Clostridia bacterium]